MAKHSKSGRRMIAGTSVAMMSLALVDSAYAQDSTTPTCSDESCKPTDGVAEIVVTGFRESLSQALEVKKQNVGAVDAIMAEDIADFPDQNLAESLQRIPGITITRDSGEGRNITVRGLSGEYTRIRINGMEAIAATGGEGGPNRGREFDFNVFASELFNSIVVHKTASASLEEGSLGAVVDLNTGRPFSYDKGVTFVTSVEGQYNDLTEDTSPRLAGLFSYHDPDGRWGASFSAAYSDADTIELGQNTVRWQASDFASVGGVDCSANPDDSGCTEVGSAFHPRIPRYGEIAVNRKRLGLTGSLQFQIGDATTLTLDSLYSKLDASRGEKWLEVLFRSNEGGMDVSDYTYDAATNNLTMMSVNNAWVRTENFKKAWTTEFSQIGVDLEHQFNDSLSMDLLVGTSRSELDFPYEITYMYDNRTYDGFMYDYGNDKKPVLAYNGLDVSDPSIFQLTEMRDRPTNTKHNFDNAALDFDWKFADEYGVRFGAAYKKFTFKTDGYRRDTGICSAGLYECDTDGDGVDDLVGIPATADLSEIYHFSDPTGAGSTTTWAIPSLSGWDAYLDRKNLPLSEDQGNIMNVTEKDTSVYIQLDGNSMVGDMDLMYDAGVRYTRTDQSSSGYNSGTWVTVNRPVYDDFLPSANVALFITPDLIWRSAAAKVMTRPGLGNLSPGGSVDSYNFKVSYKNPYLDPTRATNVDTSLEWYFAKEAILSLALFYKDIKSFPISSERTGTYASTGLPLSLLAPTSPAEANPEAQDWTISTLDNGPGAKIKGSEIGFQTPFTLLAPTTPVIRNMGIIGNFTYVDSDVKYTFGDEVISERLLGLSKYSYNATLYYENETFSARVSAAYRDDYLTGTSGTGNIFEGYGASFNVDMSGSYKLNEHFDVSFEALNLTDEYQDRWTDVDTKRRYEWDHTGRIFKLGLKYKY